MSNMHIREVDPLTGVAEIVMHFTTPAGNNAVGTSWANALVASGRNTTIMVVGNGGGQITTAENNQVTAGTVLEYVTQFFPDPHTNNAGRLAQMDALYAAAQQAVFATLQERLKYYGLTR